LEILVRWFVLLGKKIEGITIKIKNLM